MKRILLLAGILIAVSSVLQAQPKIKFEKETQELGYVLWRNPVTVTYHFTNDGDKPLVISNVTTSCGCTEAKWTEDPIPAGGKGEVTAIFDAEPSAGSTRKSVCIAMPLPLPFILDSTVK